MAITVDVAIAKDLQESIGDYKFSCVDHPAYLNSNDEWTRGEYCLLVLDSRQYELYTEPRYRCENEFDAVGYYDVRVNTPEDIDAVCRVLRELAMHPGVLTYSQISTLMRLRILVYDGSRGRVQGASYDLVVDREFMRSGVSIEEADTITINPFDHVVVGAKESVNFPKNICGTFDVAVNLFCRGVILSNGPQLDPGYCGRLLCLLFNTSSKDFAMTAYQDFEYATVQFQTLSNSTARAYTGSHQRKRRIRDYIAQYTDESMANRLMSLTDLQKQNQQVSTEVVSLSDKLDKSVAKMESTDATLLGLTRVGLIVAVASLVVVLVTIVFGILFRYDYVDSVKAVSEVKSDISDSNKRMEDMARRINDLEVRFTNKSPNRK